MSKQRAGSGVGGVINFGVHSCRKENLEGGPFVYIAKNGNKSAVTFDNPKDGRKAKARSFPEFFCCEERIEDFLDGAARHSGSGVADANQNVCSRSRARRRRCIVFVDTYVFRRNYNCASLGHGIPSVD